MLCDHGDSSIFAAATLVELGFAGAGDVIGGFEAWRACRASRSAPLRRRRGAEQLAGMGGAD